jgi:hypothetical protein
MITQDDVIYFVLTDRFRNGDRGNDRACDPSDPKAYHGGDFAGLLERLPYLVDLGVTAVWITPVYLSIGKHGDSAGYHGYWALDFERLDPHLYTAQPGRAITTRPIGPIRTRRCRTTGSTVAERGPSRRSWPACRISTTTGSTWWTTS